MHMASNNIMFNVIERPVYHKDNDGAFEMAPRYKALVREDNSHMLAIVGSEYKVVQNTELFGTIHEDIISTAPELYNHEIKDSTAYYGGVAMRQYIFPGVRHSVRKYSSVALRMIFVNSFGKMAVKAFIGAIDFFCANGIIRGNYDSAYFRHTSGLTVERIKDRSIEALSKFDHDAIMWSKWAKTKITDAGVMEFLNNIGISETLAKRLLGQYRMEAFSHGETVWALYSALTHYASHSNGEFSIRRTANDHEATTMLNRERNVAAWIAHDKWQELVAA